jgi:hypothetical protein
MLNNMRAIELFRRRIVYGEQAFAELVLWQLPSPPPGSRHPYKHRLAYVVDGHCVLRDDNEAGKCDHRHFRNQEPPYVFDTVEALLLAFQLDIERIAREDPHP